MYLGMRAPHIFGHVLSQSGSFNPGGFDTVLTDLVKYQPRKSIKLWMDVGRYEWLLESNRAFHKLLRAKGYAVTYREYNAGHNYPAWRNDVAHGLEEMFGT